MNFDLQNGLVRIISWRNLAKKVEIAPDYKAQNGISGHIYMPKIGISWQKYG